MRVGDLALGLMTILLRFVWAVVVVAIALLI